MPSDWIVYALMQPSGWLVIAAAVGLPFLIWHAVLGAAFGGVGFRPLVAAYAAAALGLLAFAFGWAHLEFGSRVARQALPESERWATVGGWTLYVALLALPMLLPLLGLVAVPLAAWLLRTRRFTVRVIAAGLAATWLLLAAAATALPANDWQRAHRVQALGRWVLSLAPPVLLVGLPFLVAIHALSRRHRAAPPAPASTPAPTPAPTPTEAPPPKS